MDISTLLGQGGVWSQISVPFWGIWGYGSVWSAGSHPPQSRWGDRVWELKGGRLLGHRVLKDIGHRIGMDTKISEKLQLAQALSEKSKEEMNRVNLLLESIIKEMSDKYDDPRLAHISAKLEENKKLILLLNSLG